ncbi:MAG: EamA/RhaT family transporter [Flavobacteriaceae bacterium]|jgi:drug/metabolite transporter (DMT)-like permease|nr:EamA/RhaT family transporter [Flavobacteriaceae bacterium]
MFFLVLSILGSVSVGIYLKIVKKFNASILQMISFNYLITIICSYFFFNVDLSVIPVSLPIVTISSLAILLPSIFLVQFYSIQYTGIIKTDIAQRLSLFIPIIAAIMIFNEVISSLRYIALAIGLIAVYFIVDKPHKNQIIEKKNRSFIYPLFVFLGFGIIDIFFKQLALYSIIPYTSSLFYVFAAAFVISILINIFFYLKNKQTNFLELKSILLGIPLGLLNFLNIVCYMKAHREFAESPTTVFAGMNFGVILLGTLVGYFLFNEKLSKKNVLGLIMALIAVTLILISQQK